MIAIPIENCLQFYEFIVALQIDNKYLYEIFHISLANGLFPFDCYSLSHMVQNPLPKKIKRNEKKRLLSQPEEKVLWWNQLYESSQYNFNNNSDNLLASIFLLLNDFNGVKLVILITMFSFILKLV